MFDLNYFKYLLKKNKHTFIYIGIIFFAAFLFPLFGDTVLDGNILDNKNSYTSTFSTLIFITISFSFILPFVNFSHKFNKRAIDLYDALPIKKEKSLITILVFQAFELIVPLVIMAIFGFVMIKGTSYEINKMLGYGILLIIVVMTINTAIIFKTNSIFDGVVMLGAYHILPFILYAAVDVILSSLIQTIRNFPLINKITYLSPFALYLEIIHEDKILLLAISVLLIYFVIAAVSLYFDYLNRKPEKVESISDNFFAYRLIVNVYLFLVALMIASGKREMGTTLSIALFTALIAIFIFADFIYVRKIRINLRKVVKALVLIVIAIGIVKFIDVNRCFGLDKIYPVNYTNINYSYYSNVALKDSEGKLYNGGIEFYYNGGKEGNEDFIKELQKLQNTLADDNYGINDFWSSPHFNVYYSNEYYVNGKDYTRVDTLADYSYKTDFETISHIFKDNKNVNFTGYIYDDERYSEFADYDEFLSVYEIIYYDNLSEDGEIITNY